MWYKNPTVTFESNGGSTISSQTIAYNTTATELTTAPTLANYTFGGWYTDAECTKEYSFTTKVTTDLTLYAKWTSTNGELPDMGAVDLN